MKRLEIEREVKVVGHSHSPKVGRVVVCTG